MPSRLRPLLSLLLASHLVAARGQAPERREVESRGVSRPFVEGVWLEHLWLQMDRVRDQPRAVERYARRILQFKANDRLALKSLIRSVLTRQEYQYAALLCHYGVLLDDQDPEWEFHLRRLRENAKDARLLKEAPTIRITVMRDQIAKAAEHGDTAALKDLEGQLRDQLARHELDAGLVSALAEAYTALEEPTLAAAAWREAHALATGDRPVFEAYTRALETVGEGAQVLTAALASTRELSRDPAFNRYTGLLLQRNGYAWYALGYLGRWCADERRNPKAWEALGGALESIGEENQARAAYIHAVRDATQPDAMLRKLALLAAKDRNTAEAAIWVDRLKGRIPEDDLVEFLSQPEFENVPDLLLRLQ